MKKENEPKRKKYRALNVLAGIILGMYLVVSGYLVYNIYNYTGIENLIRYIAMGALIVIDLFVIIRYFIMRKRPKAIKYIILIIVLLILGGAEFFISYSLGKGLNFIDKISVKDYKVYKTSLITLKSTNITKVSEITKDTKIGRVSDEEDIENHVLTEEIIDKHDNITTDNIVDYEEPITMLYELYEGKIQAAFISGGYVDLYKGMQKFEKIEEEAVELDKFSKKMKVKESSATKSTSKSITEPFTLLLLGVDSEAEDISNAFGLGDSIMVITFNPNTLNATVLSIPRDTFVPITCYRNVRSKITHAAGGGDECMINTVQNFLDVKIDYYVKVNFRGLVRIVDAIGGIDVDVPNALCEQNSLREFGDSIIYVEKGWQHLDGEQALALSRNRKTVPECGSYWNQGDRSDFKRGQNQQLVINAIINKIKNMSSIDQLYSLLDAVGGSMATNMTRNQILSFYNIFKRILLYSEDLTSGNNIIDMQKCYLNGSGALIQDGVMSSMNLYEYVPSNESLNAIIQAMKENLELVDTTPTYSFSFSADESYEPKVIGADLYGGIASYPALPDEDEAQSECGENQEKGTDGVTCVCKTGYETVGGVCVKKADKDESVCPKNEELQSDGTCKCASGYTKNSDGVCEKDDTSQDDKKYMDQCVSEGDVYYWYDSNGDKNPTTYYNSTCDQTEPGTPTSPETPSETPSEGSE